MENPRIRDLFSRLVDLQSVTWILKYPVSYAWLLAHTGKCENPLPKLCATFASTLGLAFLQIHGNACKATEIVCTV